MPDGRADDPLLQKRRGFEEFSRVTQQKRMVTDLMLGSSYSRTKLRAGISPLVWLCLCDFSPFSVDTEYHRNQNSDTGLEEDQSWWMMKNICFLVLGIATTQRGLSSNFPCLFVKIEAGSSAMNFKSRKEGGKIQVCSVMARNKRILEAFAPEMVPWGSVDDILVIHVH